MSEDLAWAAGLFDGEGTATSCNGRARLALKMVEEEPVRRFSSVVGIGKVYGPYANGSGAKDGYPRRDFFMWVADGPDAALAFAEIKPWLSTFRLDRAAEILTADR